MTLSPDDDFAAAEFALGTLEPGERATLAARRLREPELDAAIRAWEARLSPLAEATPPIAPPADFLPAIEARIRAGAAAAAADGVATLQKRLSRWRAAAIGATGIAAALAIGFVAREATRASRARPNSSPSCRRAPICRPSSPRSISPRASCRCARVAAPPQAGKSYELWIIEPKLGAPRSLGVIDAAARDARPASRRFRSRRRRGRNLRGDGRARRRLARRQAVGAAGLRRQTCAGRAMSAREPIPLHVVTGFLGAGKTSLINRMLKSAALADALVIVNEWGEIGLDHLLFEAVEGEVISLNSGCLCCTLRGDLVDRLNDLLDRRDAGTIAPFARVILETTGLADPAPILLALAADPRLAARFRVAGVTTLVDAVNGEATLAARGEAQRQAALADRIGLAKSDLVAADARSADSPPCARRCGRSIRSRRSSMSRRANSTRRRSWPSRWPCAGLTTRRRSPTPLRCAATSSSARR